MSKDPVCGMQVSETATAKSVHKGKTYYFCSTACKKSFDRNPEKVLERSVAGVASTDMA